MIKVLIADDEPKIRRGLTRLVEDSFEGFTVVGTAADGEEALVAINEHHPDIILLDLCMPFSDGFDLMGKLNMDRKSHRIIVVSGYDDFEYARKSLKMGVFDYVLKPVNRENLHTVMCNARTSLLESREEGNFFEWARRQVRDSMEPIIEHFFREWIERGLSSDEVLRSLDFLGISLPRECGIIVVRPRAAVKQQFGLHLSEQYRIQAVIIEAVRAAILPLDPVVSFWDTDGRYIAIVRRTDIPEWADVGTEIAGRVNREPGVSMQAAYRCSPVDAAALPAVCVEIIKELEEVRDENLLSQRALNWIDSNYFNVTLNLEALAEYLAVSPSHSSVLIKNATGLGFVEYLNNVRIKRASQLVRDPTIRLGEIAEMVGYRSHHYFCRVFKRVLGVSPSELRYQRQEGTERE